MVTKPIDGKPATTLNGGTIGFLMSDAKQAEAWHNAGVANGGTSIEDPPGVRANGAYLADVRDPDGHKLVGVACKMPDLIRTAKTEEGRPFGEVSSALVDAGDHRLRGRRSAIRMTGKSWSGKRRLRVPR
jgi:hypothetical protein